MNNLLIARFGHMPIVAAILQTNHSVLSLSSIHQLNRLLGMFLPGMLNLLACQYEGQCSTVIDLTTVVV